MVTQLIESQVMDPYHLHLSRPIQATADSNVIVAVMALDDLADEREFWNQLSDEGLAIAYGDNEQDYSSPVIREPNSEYAVERGVAPALIHAQTEETLMRVVRALPPERREDVLDYALFVKARLIEKTAEADQRAWARAFIRSLAKYWDTPEDDAAWAYLQEATSS